MRLRLIAVGGRMPDWVQAGFDDYEMSELEAMEPVR